MPLRLLLLALLLQDQIVFRSDVALVRVDAEVRTASGPVSDLRRDSFRVTDNGLDQTIVYFAHDEQPLDVILLFDTSNSMRPVVARVAEAAHMAMGELRAGDRVGISAKPAAAARFSRLPEPRHGSFSNSMLRTGANPTAAAPS